MPVLVEPVTLPPLYAPLIHLDLTGLDEAAAAARLRARLAGRSPDEPAAVSPAGSGADGQAGVRRPPCRRCGGCRRAIRGSPAGTACSPSCGGGCAPVRPRWWCRRCTGWAGWARPSWRSSTRTGSPPTTTWCGGSTPSSRCSSPTSSPQLAARLDLPARADGGRHRGPAAGRAAADRDRWLLIFDNAERPADIADYRPGGAGHVLITSRSPGWGALGGRLEVDVLTRAETVALLRARIPALGDELADELAAELGDLPLAAAQAAGLPGANRLPAGSDYLRRFRARRADSARPR